MPTPVRWLITAVVTVGAFVLCRVLLAKYSDLHPDAVYAWAGLASSIVLAPFGAWATRPGHGGSRHMSPGYGTGISWPVPSWEAVRAVGITILVLAVCAAGIYGLVRRSQDRARAERERNTVRWRFSGTQATTVGDAVIDVRDVAISRAKADFEVHAQNTGTGYLYIQVDAVCRLVDESGANILSAKCTWEGKGKIYPNDEVNSRQTERMVFVLLGTFDQPRYAYIQLTYSVCKGRRAWYNVNGSQCAGGNVGSDQIPLTGVA